MLRAVADFDPRMAQGFAMKGSRLALALSVAGALSAGAVAGYRLTRTPVAARPVQAAAAERPVRALSDFSALVERNGAAVVNVRVFEVQAGLPEDAMALRGQGSGFIVSSDGIILTDAHVLDGATAVTVQLADRRELRAKVIGADARSDVAVLKIDAKDLPAVKLGDPRALRAGEWVVAIGAPFGFENTVTAGIVSAKGRSLPDQSYVPFIQTDVAVNPGDSGGPLFNLAGEVVGINSQILSRSGGYQGLSFAIPIDIAVDVKDQIIARGHVTRGFLGVTAQAVNAQLADSFGLEKPAGVLVSSVLPGSPAAKAGLQTGDVILGLNGSAIEDPSALPPRVAGLKPGTRAQLDVWRRGSAERVAVSVGELKERDEIAARVDERLGLALRPLTRQEQRAAGATNGLVVERASGAAAQAGVQPGDVVLAVNGKPLGSVAELQSVLATTGRRAALLLRRGSTQLFIPVTLG